MKLLFLNGPNMNMLGVREPDIYGRQTYADLENYIRDFCRELGIECELYQSNHEGDLVDAIQRAYGTVDGIVINPAAYTHTSVAILDALKAVGLPAVEGHISAASERESLRQGSHAGVACRKTLARPGFAGYRMAAEHLLALQRGVIAGASSRVEITVE